MSDDETKTPQVEGDTPQGGGLNPPNAAPEEESSEASDTEDEA